MEKLTHKQLAIEFEKAKKGDQEAFAKIYQATNKSQYFLAFANLHNQQMAEDVLQDLYIKLFQGLNNIENGTALIAYMNRMNYNLCMTKLSKEKENTKVDIDDLSFILVDQKDQPSDIVNKKSETEMIYLALSKLDKRLSSVLIMRFIDEMKVKDVASVLKISPRSVLRYTEEGCRKMRKMLKNLKNKVYSLPIFSVPFIANSLRSLRDSGITPSKQEAIFSNIMNCDHIKAAVATATTSTATSTAVAEAVTLKTVPAFSTSLFAIGGVVGAAAITTIGVASIQPSYTLQYATDLTTYNPSYVEMSVQNEGSIGLSGVELYNANNEIVSRGNKSNNYTVYADQNGTYILRIVGMNYAEKSEQITITTIDNQCPSVSAVQLNSDDITFTISDDLSGIDYKNITLVSDSGEPVEYWMDGNTIHYSNAYPVVTATVIDNVGNATTAKLTVQ